MRITREEGRWRRLRFGAAAATAAVVLGLATAASAAAQPGALDGAFNGSGFVATSGVQLLGVAVQPNGEVVAAGQQGGNVYVERFKTSGQPDGIFSGQLPGAAHAVAVQSNGDIVVAGAYGSAMLVARLTPNLTLDPSFGSNGMQIILAGGDGVGNAIALAPNGGIAVAGSVGTYPNTYGAAAEFNTSGSPVWQNGSFGGLHSSFSGVTVEPNGNVVAVGQQTPSQAVNALMGVFSSSGGVLSASTYNYPGAGSTYFGGVAVLGNQLVVDGQANAGTPQAFFARYSLSGTPDPSFGSGGATAVPASASLSINPGYPVGAYGIGITGPSGVLVGAGSFENGALEVDAALWAVSSSGALESGFGNQGGTEVGPGPSVTGGSTNYEACAVAIAPDGSPDAGEIVTVGDTPAFSKQAPCTIGESSNGFVASYTGYGPPPAPPPPNPGAAPSVTTGSASGVKQTTATVSAQVNPNGLSTTYFFQYGTTTSYGSNTPTAGAGSGTSAVPASAVLTGLAPGTTYHYRLVADNADGTTNGADGTFTTAGMNGPSATTGRASWVGELSARVTGTVSTGGLPTTYHFEYGTTTSYGSSTTAQAASTSPVNVAATLKRLKPGTTYHYRLVAVNADGTAAGADRTFKTLPRLVSAIGKLAGTQSLKSLLAHGLTIHVTCSRPCSVSGLLLVSAATARQLRLGKRQTSVAGGHGTLRKGRTITVTLRVTRQASAVLAKQKKLVVTLRVVAKPTGGGPWVTHTKTITLEG